MTNSADRLRRSLRWILGPARFRGFGANFKRAVASGRANTAERLPAATEEPRSCHGRATRVRSMGSRCASWNRRGHGLLPPPAVSRGCRSASELRSLHEGRGARGLDSGSCAPGGHGGLSDLPVPDPPDGDGGEPRHRQLPRPRPRRRPRRRPVPDPVVVLAAAQWTHRDSRQLRL
jgi:hypothetical protein